MSKNIFAALNDKPKKKKEKPSKPEKEEVPEISAEELERAIFSKADLGVSNWASDSEDEDDHHHHHHHQPEPEPGWSIVGLGLRCCF